MDALKMAKEKLESGFNESYLTMDWAMAWAMIASAEAAQRQAAALERIAEMLPQIHDALYAPSPDTGNMESVAQYLSWIEDRQ